jgi:hypothetical protein
MMVEAKDKGLGSLIYLCIKRGRVGDQRPPASSCEGLSILACLSVTSSDGNW